MGAVAGAGMTAPTDRPYRWTRFIAKRALVRTAGSGVMSSLCAVGLLATSGWLITTASTRPPVYVLSVAIGAVQAFALGRGIFRYVQRLSVHDMSLAALGQLRLRLFDDLEPLVPGGLPAEGTGGVLSAFVADAETVSTGLVQGVTASVDVATSVVLGLVLAIVLAPAAAAVLAIGSMAVIGIVVLVARLGRRSARREADLRAELAASVVDTMRSARELVVYGRQDLIDAGLESVGKRSASAALAQAVYGGASRALTVWVAGATLIGVVTAALAAHSSHHLSGVMVAVVAFAALATMDQMGGLPAAFSDIAAADAASDRLAVLSHQPAAAPEPLTDHSPAKGPVSTALDRVTVVAPDGTVRLRGASLHLAPGQRMALVGRNGSGKTTAAHVILHFAECTQGRATIGGTDVTTMTRAGMATHVGWTPAAPHIFSTTVAENLRIGRPTASDADCLDALARVGLEVWVQSLPEGLGTLIGSGGRPMSAGEGQKLGLARALLAGGSVLVLDEPTAHIDPWASSHVMTELLGAVGGRSVLVISHDPEVGEYVDTVVTAGQWPTD